MKSIEKNFVLKTNDLNTNDKMISLRLPSGLLKKFDYVAKRSHSGRSSLIRGLIERLLSELPESPE